jgi:outer membrane protein assembly factor BamB
VRARRPVLAAATLATVATILGALPAARAAPGAASDWTRFGFDAARHNAAGTTGGITAANVATLHRRQVQLDGTVDSSPIYLAGVDVGGARHDTLFVTTTYGKTLAIDARSGRILWRYVPPGFDGWAGTAQITNTTPVADPGRVYVYAASPDGRIQKLSLRSGRRVWSTAITRDPTHEKLASALNFSRGLVIATTGGYVGDAPPYQGHVVTIRATTGRIVAVFNSLCSNRRALIVPSSCSASDSAIWARAGAVVDPDTGNLLVATGNGPWNGSTNWGDSVLELSPNASRLLQNWTPTDQRRLEASDIDLGSTAPALLGGGLALQSGKDAKLRVLDLRRLNGRSRSAGAILGGELQTLPAPGGAGVFTAPAVRNANGTTYAFVSTFSATAGYRLRGRRLVPVWTSTHAGTSPVVAGGLLFVYDPDGGLYVYAAQTGKELARLDCGPGHWNSPVIADGRIALPEGNANDHSQSGILDIWSLGAS